MNKHVKSKLPLFLLLTVSPLFAQISSGDALKINSCYGGKKALFMKNATLDNNVDAIVWTETNVPAQRWIASDAGEGLFFLTNAYSGHPLSNYSTRPGVGSKIVLKSNNEAYGKWGFIPVENPSYPNAYYVCLFFQSQSGGDKLYLETGGDTDGAGLTLQAKRNNVDSLRQMWTVVAEDILPNRVTPSLRDSVMRGWKDRYFNWLKSETTGFWGEAEMLETILDAYETSGKQEYKTMFEEAYAHFVSGNGGWGVKGNGKDWRWNEYNDDIAWAVLASVRAYLMFGQHPNSSINYLTIATNNYNWMYNRALLPSGMLRWKQSPSGNQGSNSCINGPAEVAACYLAIATGDDNYYEKAKNLYALQRQHLYDPNTGKVFDSGSWSDNVFAVGNHWVSTYNQGTFLGAALMLYNRYGTAQYLTDAHKIAEWTRNDLCNASGVVRVCGSGDDLQGFKGILMRYLRRYIVDLALPDKVEWMQRNALQAYNNRNSAGIIWTAWWEKSAENFVYSDGYNFSNRPFGSSTALSAAFNAPLSPEQIIKDAFKFIEAENFDYVRGILVERESDEAAVIGNMADGYYTAYNHVDFGDEGATGVEFLVQSNRTEGKQIEIRLDSPSGELLGFAELPSSNGIDWISITCTIKKVTGRRHLYLVYKGAAFKIDRFRFTNGTSETKNPLFSTKLTLYPNPVVDFLKVDCPHAGCLVVYDALGKEISSTATGSGTNTLNVTGYPEGLYFLTVFTDKGNYVARFLKK